MKLFYECIYENNIKIWKFGYIYKLLCQIAKTKKCVYIYIYIYINNNKKHILGMLMKVHFR